MIENILKAFAILSVFFIADVELCGKEDIKPPTVTTKLPPLKPMPTKEENGPIFGAESLQAICQKKGLCEDNLPKFAKQALVVLEEDKTLKIQGFWRLSASAADTNEYVSKVNGLNFVIPPVDNDRARTLMWHLFKRFLKDLKQHIVPREQSNYLLTIKEMDKASVTTALAKLSDKSMPLENKILLNRIFKLLNAALKFVDTNKMDALNLASLAEPTLYAEKTQKELEAQMKNKANGGFVAMKYFIENYEKTYHFQNNAFVLKK